MEGFINKKGNKEDPEDEEILFGNSQRLFRPPSFARLFVANDLHTPDLQHIFWASIRIPVPSTPGNVTNAMFDALDEFLTKMKEADCWFMVFLHNHSQYRMMENLPFVIEEPEDSPTEVNDWLTYFLQVKPRFNGGDMYTTALIGCSILLGWIMERTKWLV